MSTITARPPRRWCHGAPWSTWQRQMVHAFAGTEIHLQSHLMVPSTPTWCPRRSRLRAETPPCGGWLSTSEERRRNR